MITGIVTATAHEVSHDFNSIELRSAKLFGRAAGEDGELAQGECVFENEDGVVAFSSFI